MSDGLLPLMPPPLAVRPGPRPGTRPSGRQAGTPNKLTAERETTMNEAMIAATAALSEDEIKNLDPLTVIQTAMQIAIRAASWFKAADLADKIIDYVHPKLQSISVTNTNDDAAKSRDALEREFAEITSRSEAANSARIATQRMQGQLPELGDRGTVPTWIPASEAPRPTVNGA